MPEQQNAAGAPQANGSGGTGSSSSAHKSSKRSRRGRKSSNDGSRGTNGSQDKAKNNGGGQKGEKKSSSKGGSGRSSRSSRHSGKRSSKGGKSPALRIIPLGGLDAIGKNMTAFECEGDLILVDAGLMFPDDEHVGVDLILPDYTYVLEHADRLRGIVITHGHEDHTGALPYLLKDLDRRVPILGTKLTLGMIAGKLEEHHLSKQPELREVHRGGSAKLGCFDLEFYTVNHSIPGAMGVFMHTPAGNVLHTGDFKLDQTPIDGELTDFAALARYSAQGVDLFMSDSTNATKPEFTKSEAEVGKTLRRVIGSAKQRVIVAAFSSHIHRVQQVCDAAQAAGRKVAVTGRSMLTNTRIARELGYLNVPDDLLIDAFDVSDYRPDKIVVLCTGSQGEPLSALARMSVGEHRTISIEKGDTVIISATPVPGNEKSVTRVINQLSKIGADIWDKNRALVHVSGHAGQEELKIVLSLVKPRYFLPVHGEASHLRAHARLAEAVGVDPDHIFILDNGDSLKMQNGKVVRDEPVESGIVYVDGSSVGDIGQDVLRDRQSMSNEGVASLVLVFDKRKHELAAAPEITMRGIPGFDLDDFVGEASEVVEKAVSDQLEAHHGDVKRASKAGRDALSKFLWSRAHRRPVIMPSVVQV
ncbi:MAG: ribonuclease J [Coriobacteriales bacterium]|jgi:ribonuclease J